MVEEASRHNDGMQHVESAHTAVSNTKPTAYKTQPLTHPLLLDPSDPQKPSRYASSYSDSQN